MSVSHSHSCSSSCNMPTVKMKFELEFEQGTDMSGLIDHLVQSGFQSTDAPGKSVSSQYIAIFVLIFVLDDADVAPAVSGAITPTRGRGITRGRVTTRGGTNRQQHVHLNLVSRSDRETAEGSPPPASTASVRDVSPIASRGSPSPSGRGLSPGSFTARKFTLPDSSIHI